MKTLLRIFLITAASVVLGVLASSGRYHGFPFADAEPGSAALRAAGTGLVTDAIDGDTLKVRLGSGREVVVRLIGYDTPESVRPGVDPECGSHRASLFTGRITEGRQVTLVRDPSQDPVDRYGRLLRYATINGRDIGKRVISAGWGAPYVFDASHPPKKASIYRSAAQQAKADNKGIWDLCDGNFHSEADRPWSGD